MDATEAKQALDDEDGVAALAAYSLLEQQDALEGDWARGVADACRLLKDKDGELSALGRAADRYTAAGASLDAIVMLKRILDLDPTRTHARGHMAALFGGAPSKAKGRTSDVPKDEAPLSLVTATNSSGEADGVFAIPVFSADEFSDAFDAAIEATGDVKEEKERTRFPLSPFFSAVSEDGFTDLLADLRIFSAPPGARLFTQGDKGTSFFIITKGSVSVTLEDASRTRLAVLHAGEIFGEIALLTDQPRTATVEVESEAELIEVDRMTMSRLIYEDEAVMPVLLWFLRERLVDTLIRTSPIFSEIPVEKRRGLADRFQFLEAKTPTTLIDQGQSPRGVIIVLAGTASVVRTFDLTSIPLGTLGPGDVCGEMSLLTNEPALASVETEGNFVGLELARDNLVALIAETPALLSTLSSIAETRRQAFVDAIERRTASDTHLPIV